MNITLTPGQKAVLLALADLGKPVTDAALVPFAQHMSGVHQSSSGIRSRRKELERKGYVVLDGHMAMPSGRKAYTYTLTSAGKATAKMLRRQKVAV